MLKQKLQEEVIRALKDRSDTHVRVLRFLLAELHNREIEKRGTGQAPILTDEEEMNVLQREAKKRKEAIELMRKGGRDELAAGEEAELRIIQTYLPPQATAEEIARLVEEAYQGGVKDFPGLMRETMKKLRGNSDGKEVARVVKHFLDARSQ